MRGEGGVCGVTEILMPTQKELHTKNAQDKDSVQNRMSGLGITSRRESRRAVAQGVVALK